jgi:hypothetical protein
MVSGAKRNEASRGGSSTQPAAKNLLLLSRSNLANQQSSDHPTQRQIAYQTATKIPQTKASQNEFLSRPSDQAGSAGGETFVFMLRRTILP